MSRQADHGHFDILIRGGTIVTAETARPLIEDGVIGVRHGRIALLETSHAVDHEPTATKVIDGRGHAILPGFVNVHTHAALILVRGMSEDMGFAPAYMPNVPQGPMLSPDDARALARLGALELVRFGTTLINDSYVYPHSALPGMGEVGLRVYACNRIHDVDFAALPRGTWQYDDRRADASLAEALALADKWHGKMDGRLGVQLSAHAPDTCSPRLLRMIAAARDEHKLRVNIHLAQSQAEFDQVMARDKRTPVETIEDAGLLDSALMAAHCLILTESDIARLGKARVNMAHASKISLMSGIHAPTSALRRAGVQLCVVTDGMHGDMLEVMRWALAIGRLQEKAVTSFWQPEHVLAAATINGARAMGLDAEIGSLKVGKKADLVMFDLRKAHLTPATSALGALTHAGQGGDVAHVLVDGKVVIENGRSTQVDEEEIRREAAAACKRLWQKARAAAA
ncbi:MAG: amidohydrolase family protein [Parvibaculaceae bacterium]